ncbi:RsfA family transcriptional regulator [Sediminibacillus massiliensis]|uniref:RsfA family transcriptional regulator n=1 Tax=Sediminibacillus massiliensis TaxID=1926277 RepID=UPI0009887A7A|nr:RsfA family transcriptional regulator [Sediminibacillus massiliensis]
MNNTRQDAWSQDEDVLLAETVLRYIRDGKTQLEAFKEVANRLSRTPAACGFRWNAAIRKQYQKAIELAKKDRKQGDTLETYMPVKDSGEGEVTLDAAISLLEKMRTNYNSINSRDSSEEELEKLIEENKILKSRLKRYQEAWREIGVLWKWVETPSSDKQTVDK